MFNRACENKCKNEFMKLGRNKHNHSVELSETSIVLASGAYDLRYPSMDGRLQIDVFTYMRKEFILPNYKLDFVSSHLISDKIKSYINNEQDNTCKKLIQKILKELLWIVLFIFKLLIILMMIMKMVRNFV